MPMKSRILDRLSLAMAATLASLAALLTACGTRPLPPDPAPPIRPVQPESSGVESRPEQQATGIGPPKIPRPSGADNASAYRKDAASHLYSLNNKRIYKGKLPPLLYAIGVLDVDIDGQGRVARLSWRRAPNQAPEVIAEIERTVRQAAPFPAPSRLGRVTYTDVWLWDESGRFQLDTLTEGQM
jgi:protein TonB